MIYANDKTHSLILQESHCDVSISLLYYTLSHLIYNIYVIKHKKLQYCLGDFLALKSKESQFDYVKVLEAG